VVQAALQCGPYKGAEGQAVSLAADFSAIQPAVDIARGGERGAASGASVR
jgi:hypothetical protein